MLGTSVDFPSLELRTCTFSSSRSNRYTAGWKAFGYHAPIPLMLLLKLKLNRILVFLTHRNHPFFLLLEAKEEAVEM